MQAMTTETDHPAVRRVSAALAAAGAPLAPQWLAQSTATAAQAAAALGVPLGAIAKSVLLRAGAAGAVLCITAGDRRVDAERLPAALQPTLRADAEAVRRFTGFAIGGVSPLALQPAEDAPAPTLLIDDSLWRFAQVWAAAGHPRAVFAASPDQLQQWSGAARAVFAHEA